MDINDARPPYVMFESRSEEDRLNMVPGEPTKYKDVHYAFITPVGSKDRIERNVADWFENLEQQVRQERYERKWFDAHKAAYEAWKNDQEPPLNGTSIKLWPILTPAQTKSLLALRVLCVEDLAVANEETVNRIGMGGRALKDQAIAWLKTQEKDGVSTLVKTNNALLQRVDALLARNTVLEEANAELKKLAAAQAA